MGIERPFCEVRILEDADEHMRKDHLEALEQEIEAAARDPHADPIWRKLPALIQRLREAKEENQRLLATIFRAAEYDAQNEARVTQLERVREAAQDFRGCSVEALFGKRCGICTNCVLDAALAAVEEK